MYCAAETEKDRKDIVRDLTSYMLHKYYGENDVEAVVALFADPYAPLKICRGLEEYLERKGLRSVRELTGTVQTW